MPMRIPIVAVLVAAAAAAAPAAKLPVAHVKAAFVFNFARFTTWPEAALAEGDTLAICALGGGAVTEALAGFDGRTIRGHTVDVRPLAGLADPSSCHVLYLDTPSAEHRREAIAAVSRRAVLTVGDADAFARDGGMIELVPDGAKLRFEVNVARTKAAGLVMSSKLLKLATIAGGSN